MAKVPRSQIAHFINTGTPGAPVWKRLGKGITTGAIQFNPQVTDETYIDEDSGSTFVESYKPTMPIEASLIYDNEALAYLEGKMTSHAVLSAAETELLNVWMYKPGGPTAYQAEKYAISIQSDNLGGDAGKTAKASWTLNYLGDPVLGTFNATTLTFTPT